MDRSQVSAESAEEAFRKFIIGKEENDFEVVVVSASSFWDSIKNMPESFPNPLFKAKNATNNNLKWDATDSNLNPPNKNIYSANNVYETQAEKLDKLIELQEKQLYWIRIIGIPFLLAAIGSFLTLIIRSLN